MKTPLCGRGWVWICQQSWNAAKVLAAAAKISISEKDMWVYQRLGVKVKNSRNELVARQARDHCPRLNCFNISERDTAGFSSEDAWTFSSRVSGNENRYF